MSDKKYSSKTVKAIIIASALLLFFLLVSNNNSTTELTKQNPTSLSKKIYYPSFQEMINSSPDFHEGGFDKKSVIISKKPLKVNLYENDSSHVMSFEKDIQPKYRNLHVDDMDKRFSTHIMNDIRRAFLHGIYRTFSHTNEVEIHISVFINHLRFNRKLRDIDIISNNQPQISSTIKRKEALSALQKFIPSLKNFKQFDFEKIIMSSPGESKISDDFTYLYRVDIGQKKLIGALLNKLCHADKLC